MSRGFYPGTIISSLNFYKSLNLMTYNFIQKNLTSQIPKDFKKSNLDILTQENDRLLKCLKRPGALNSAA